MPSFSPWTCHDPLMSVHVVEYTDPGCPWAYSASPALAVLQWRYGAQLRWQLVVIGLTERPEEYLGRGYSVAGMAKEHRQFRRYGMPFASQPKARLEATGRACRAIVATRLRQPQRERDVLRALQFGWFTTDRLMDEPAGIAGALESVQGLDVRAILAALDDPDVAEAYAADRAQARTAEGGATHFQGKHAQTDGPVRYTAPSLVFRAGGGCLEAGGFQPVEVYDALIANLDRSLVRVPPPDDPIEVVRRFPGGVTTAEVAAVMAPSNAEPDREAAIDVLLDHAAAGRVRRVPLGDDALWFTAGTPG
jgi:2-hydroxychromene-2-carboxylate isomerase